MPAFEAATAANSAPITLYTSSISIDPMSVLPEGRCQRALTALRQRSRDAHVATPRWDDVDETRKAAASHRQRLDDLPKHKSEGGFGLDGQAVQVRIERQRLQRAETELSRLTELKDARTARWSVVGQLERAVTEWVTRGIPGGCVLE